MQNIFSLSAYETDAESFFDALKDHKADLVLDVRLKNDSQLCGFTKQRDLAYFVSQIAHARYVYDPRFAPIPDLLDKYIHHQIGFDEYALSYRSLMSERHAVQLYKDIYGSYSSICILGTATKKRRSHSEVLVSLL